jgi:hypothetical protein
MNEKNDYIISVSYARLPESVNGRGVRVVAQFEIGMIT